MGAVRDGWGAQDLVGPVQWPMCLALSSSSRKRQARHGGGLGLAARLRCISAAMVAGQQAGRGQMDHGTAWAKPAAILALDGKPVLWAGGHPPASVHGPYRLRPWYGPAVQGTCLHSRYPTIRIAPPFSHEPIHRRGVAVHGKRTTCVTWVCVGLGH